MRRRRDVSRSRLQGPGKVGGPSHGSARLDPGLARIHVVRVDHDIEVHHVDASVALIRALHLRESPRRQDGSFGGGLCGIRGHI